MFKFYCGLVLFVVCTASLSFAGGVYKKEIEYLLGVVQNTNCTFERNDDAYSGEEAVKHIQKKYDYYSDEIVSTESFIRLAASKSTFSGNEYFIVCDTVRTTSSQWLLDTLRASRNTLTQ
ncbi:MAG: DUF5329 domain-containing protein [Fibrobacterales bacterium]